MRAKPFRRPARPLAAPVIALALAVPAAADPARIEGVRAMHRADGWVISVTLRHDDTGWEDYADAWRIETAQGEVLAERVLHHPHVTEQPFTRSLTGLRLPEGGGDLRVRASTNVTGWGDSTAPLSLSR